MPVGQFIQESVVSLLEDILRNYFVSRICILYLIFCQLAQSKKRKRSQIVRPYSILNRVPAQESHMERLVGTTDIDCLVNLRMDRNAFRKLRRMLRELGFLLDKQFVCIEEQVAIFLGVLAHHKKNRIVRFNFQRSWHTVSVYVHKVLKAILRMQSRFIAKQEPIKDDCVDYRWKWFKVFLVLIKSASHTPENPIMMFNMWHTKARNVIERAFSVLKMRWDILRSASYYSIKVQIRLMMACFLLHNYICTVILVDPLDELIDRWDEAGGNAEEPIGQEFVDTIEATSERSMTRDAMAQAMWNLVSLVLMNWLVLDCTSNKDLIQFQGNNEAT
ncbi:uncharacterized protein LOC121774718 isoform X2 [Salvia splendens]|uniref:uncharacterized protein LOC121774718 isoform X2 n=1 Tax=Salvia splendens TaxID=180675 RepID=UPI001C25F3ED|nr:uncharacterized protein LOC121774718 isoform X2 [Salvia splendens]